MTTLQDVELSSIFFSLAKHTVTAGDDNLLSIKSIAARPYILAKHTVTAGDDNTSSLMAFFMSFTLAKHTVTAGDDNESMFIDVALVFSIGKTHRYSR